jgi:hypothetical protein
MEITHQSKGTRRRKQEIIKLLTEYENSALSVKEFCIQHNLNKSTFNTWQSRYKAQPKSQNDSGSRFTALKIKPAPSAAVLFAEVKGIKIYQPVAASYLKELSQ